LKYSSKEPTEKALKSVDTGYGKHILIMKILNKKGYAFSFRKHMQDMKALS
jgi:hypothetical protein